MSAIQISDDFRLVEVGSSIDIPNCKYIRRFFVEEWLPLAKKWATRLNSNHCFKAVSDTLDPIPDDKLNIDDWTKSILEPVKAILIFEERDDTIYYDASTTEAIGTASLYMVYERNKAGYYSEVPEPVTPNIPSLEELSPDADKDLKNLVSRKWRDYKQEKLARNSYLEQAYHLRQALSGDYAAAYKLLNLRTDYPYEKVIFQKLSTVDSSDLRLE